MTMTNLAGWNRIVIEVAGTASRSCQCEGLALNILCHGKPVARYHLLKAIELMDDMAQNYIPVRGRDTRGWLSLDTIFLLVLFIHFLTQLHFTFLTHFPLMFILVMFFVLCLSHSQTDNKNTIQLVLQVTKQLIYWATDILKQSCDGSSSTQSCAGTSTTKCSHHSKFRTSWTQSTSKSVSTTRRPLVIARFLASTAARSP